MAVQGSDLEVPAVRIAGLSHSYLSRRQILAKIRPALDQITFDIRSGEIFGILGPNGGGKSTLFRILSTLLVPTKGHVSVYAHDAIAEPAAVRAVIGVVFQNPSLDAKLTAYENLLHQGHLYGLSGQSLRERIDELLAWFNLQPRQHDKVERFSGGMRRRVEIAKAILHRPRLLLLDEPSTGLDPGARDDLRRLIEKLRSNDGVTIAFTTHYMDEADRCDRLAILSEGRLIALDTPLALKARIGGDVITLEPSADAESLRREITDRFAPWPADGGPRVIEGKIHLERVNGPVFVATLASALPGRLRSITVGQPTLDDVFMHLTGRTISEDQAAAEVEKPAKH